MLTAIMGNTSLAMLDEEVMARAGDSLRDIDASAKRARRMTQQLVTFAKGGEPLLESLDAGTLVRDLAFLVASGARIEVVFDPPPDLWPILADRGQMSRAIENLLLHARAETPDAGKVAIDAANEDVAKGNRLPVAPGRYLRLSIVDRGPGIEPENLPGFFDPYSATKSGDDRFSMAIAYSIIKRHGGHIEVDSKPGQGTTFRLWVPAAASPPAGAAGALPESTVPVTALRGKRILVMDDEEAIRRVSLRALRHLECDPRAVSDGAECVRVYVDAMMTGQRYDVVILDLTVPGGMGGREAMVQLQKIDSAVRAVVSSGYSEDPVMANFREYGFLAAAPKPYSVGGLGDAIRIALSAAIPGRR
jgi:two-component system, cell cycle sensor histidine kinase and response regulator CckA